MKKCNHPVGEPGHGGIDALHYLQFCKATNTSFKEDVGDPWFVNSTEHNYCFWCYAETIDQPVPDAEIARLLGISDQEVKAVYASAIQKIRGMRKDPTWERWIEIVIAQAQQKPEQMASIIDGQVASRVQGSMFMPWTLGSHADTTDDTSTQESNYASIIDEVAPDRRRKKKTSNMPVHRDGQKTDIYGLYSKKTLQRLEQEKIDAHLKSKQDAESVKQSDASTKADSPVNKDGKAGG